VSEFSRKIGYRSVIRPLVGMSVIAAAATSFVATYRGNSDVVFDPKARQEAYATEVASWSPLRRYIGEYITGIYVCNPNDNNSILANKFGGGRGPESCGLKKTESDERFGQKCLASSPYDALSSTPYNPYSPLAQRQNPTASLEVDQKDKTIIIVHPGNSNQPDLRLRFDNTGVQPLDQRTEGVLAAYNCVDNVYFP